MRPGFRQAMTWLHNWTGLLIGWLLLAIAAAGTLAVFRQELDAWCHPELARGAIDQAAAGAAAVRWLTRHAAGASGWYLDLADARSPGTLAFWNTPTGFTQATLSPLTGSPDATRASLGGEFFYRFHFELQLPYPWGRLLAAVAAEMMLTILVTGIVAHRRIFKDFFTLRTGKGQRSWLDGHVLLAVLALPFHLMITFTGIVTLATMLMPWGGRAAFHGDEAALARSLYPAITRPATGHRMALAPIAPMLRRAAARFGGAGISTVSILNPGDAAQLVTVSAGEAPGIAIGLRNLTFDGTTARLIDDHVERRPAMRVFQTLYGLHLGRFAGLASRWLYFLSGLMLTAAIATGLVLWTAKPRRERGAGFRIVERLNIGFIAGLPLAFSGFLLANRLLPISLPARADMEVAVLFALWGAALLAAWLRPPGRAWCELLSVAGATCLSTVAADAAGGWLWTGDGVAIGVDAVLLAFALALGAAAWRLSPRRETARAAMVAV